MLNERIFFHTAKGIILGAEKGLIVLLALRDDMEFFYVPEELTMWFGLAQERRNGFFKSRSVTGIANPIRHSPFACMALSLWWGQ